MAGVCILGMGDCTPNITNVVNNVTNTLNENIKQTMMSLTSNTSVFGKATQNYQVGNITGNGCSMNFGPISQSMQVSTNFSQMSKIIDEQTYNQTMASAIDNAVKSDTKATTGFMSAGANVTNTTNNYNNNINKVLNSYNYSSFQSLMLQMQESQNVGYGNINMTCTPTTPVDPVCGAHLCMGGVTQNMVVSLIASQITDSMSKTIDNILQQSQTTSKADSKTEVTSTGFFQDLGTGLTGVIGAAGSAIGMMFSIPIMIGLGLLILLVVVVLVIKYAMGGSSAQPGALPGDVMMQPTTDEFGQPQEGQLPEGQLPEGQQQEVQLLEGQQQEGNR